MDHKSRTGHCGYPHPRKPASPTGSRQGAGPRRPGPYSCSLHRLGPRQSAAGGFCTGSGGFRLKEQGEDAQRAWRAGRGARGAGGPACGATRSPQAGDDPDSQDPALKSPPPRHPSPPGPRALLWGARWRGEGAGARESPPRKKARACLSETPPAGGRKTRASRLRAEPGPRLLDLCPGQAFGLGYKLRLHTGRKAHSISGAGEWHVTWMKVQSRAL